jgi:ubiquinone/menaquinone biosynthesis C-methylase UbiE
MNNYTALAKIYDTFTVDRNNDEWAEYIIGILKANGIMAGSSILDICCGTGGITYELYKKGLRLIGLDNSEDMLEIAAMRFAENGARIQLVCQDIRDIKVHQLQDAVIFINDGINYVTDLNDVEKTFNSIYSTLKEKGIFLFDISSEWKLISMDDKSYFEETDESAYIWYNQFDEKSRLLTMDISLYTHLEDNIFEKSNEVHVQRAHKIKELEHLLKKAGFSKISYYECFTDKKPVEGVNRIQFIVIK